MTRCRRDLRSGAEIALRVILLTAAAVAPGRWGLAGRHGGFAPGLAADLVQLAGLASIAAVVAIALGARSRWRVALLGTAAVVTWSSMITMSESTLSRGVFPSWVDAAVMTRSPALMAGSLDMFLLPRNLWPTVVALPLAAAALCRWPVPSRPVRAVASAGATLLLAAVTLTLAGGAARSPLALAGPAEWGEAWACLTGPCEPRAALVMGPTVPGAHLLGWPRPQPGGHPFRRPWPAAESAQMAMSADGLVSGADRLGEALFDGDEEPVEIWQVALEGFRGDDLHVLHAAAPRALAPFVNELYDRAIDPDAGVIASRRTWTAGLRTPHGVAALLCGLGTLPFGLALPRDLDGARLRCLPDVLSEAGFDTGYAYGGAPELDRLDRFFAARGLEPRLDGALLAEAPRTAWGVTDRHLFDLAASDAGGGWRYHFLLSLSHHHPYDGAPDLPEEVAARVAAIARGVAAADEIDRRRLTALAYTDDALRRLFDRLATRRAIVVVSADHPIPERPLWTPRLPDHAEQARIPFVIWIAPALRREHEADTGLSAAIARMNEQLDHEPLSQNDIPTLLLAMLAHSAPLRDAPSGTRWHTMGGQATSPHFRPPVAEGRIMGIDAATTFYVVDADGVAVVPPEPARLVVTSEAARQSTPSLHPAAGALVRVLPES